MRAARRLILATAVVTAVLLLYGSSSAFGQTARGQKDSTDISAEATTPATGGIVQPVSQNRPSSGVTSGGAGVAPVCTYTKVPDEGQAILNGSAQLDGAQTNDLRGTAKPGAWYNQSCQNADGVVDNRTIYSPDGSPPASGGRGARPDPRDLAQQALQRVPLPAPSIAMSPGGDIPLLVNLPTFLWIDPAQWRPVTASASAGAVTSVVTAVPVRVVWDMGQGDTVTCDGPGKPYVPTLSDDAQPSDCRFTYRASSARSPNKTFSVTATIEWHVSWSATGAAGGGDLGTSRRSSSTPVRVAEIQVLNTAASRS